MTYKERIIEAMGWLGEQPDTIFIGQTVAVPGSYMYGSLEKVPMDKRIELPVAEELQMGMTLGLALQGYCVVSVYPRVDFMILALNQLINHIDKIPEMSEGKMKPRIIIRTSVGPTKPLNGGIQHTNDYGEGIDHLCSHVRVFYLDERYEPYDFIPQFYKNIHSSNAPASLVIEQGMLY